jgi:hypothetical protein
LTEELIAMRYHPSYLTSRRSGVVLLVVITLLTLFAVVGIAFVLFAQSEAIAARVSREVETVQRPDMDPEMLHAYFLSQLIYGTNNPASQMCFQSLAENLYGSAGNTIAYNGMGRPAGFTQVDFSNQAQSPFLKYSPNVPYTYPDLNNLYLAAVRASDGAVLIPSFYRTTAQGGAIKLRAQLPFQPEDGNCDVKNLPDSPGLFNPATGKFTPNDSVWIDLGFPVMKAPDGRMYKPLFAPLIQDLDNRVNVNASGNILGNIGGGYWGSSHQGWSPGEMLLDKIIGNNEAGNIFMGNQQQRNSAKGRYDPTLWNSFWAGGGWGGRSTEELAFQYAPGGHFYSSTNLDTWPNGFGQWSMPRAGSNFGFPWLSGAFTHGWYGRNDDVFNPCLYNYFDPRQNCYWLGSPPAQVSNDTWFRPSNLEALLRYGDRGSPALTSTLFMLCPQSLANPKTRRLLTTQSFDLCLPGVMPTILAAQQPPYQLAANGAAATPPAALTGQQLPAPQSQAAAQQPTPGSGEFGPNWGAVSSVGQFNNKLLNRINLNRSFVDYPMLNGQNGIDPNGYMTALQNRQAMCQEIFNVLCAVTGAGNPATATPGTPQYDALRWLAQLAVNLVDYVYYPGPQQANCAAAAPDDIATPFNWNPAQVSSINNGWVFGTVLPRLVVNEAYIQVDNTQADQMNKPQMATKYDINAWVELHNPFSADNGGSQVGGYRGIPTPMNGTARLYFPGANGAQGYAGYRLLIAQTVGDATQVDNRSTTMLQNNNVLGVPSNIMAVVDQYTADPKVQNVTLNGDALNQVVPNYQNGANPPLQACATGQNQGFYVLAPGTPQGAQQPAYFPGTSSMTNPFFGTLPVQEQAATTAGDPTLNLPNGGANTNSSMHYQFAPQTPANYTGNAFVQKLNHTIVLQRLACPYLPYQPNPQSNTSPFNPYVTVDGMLQVPIYDNVQIDGAGQHQPPQQQTRCSVGRNQPYAANFSQQVNQVPNPMGMGTVQNTFFGPNVQNSAGQTNAFAYSWLVHMNRPVINQMELLHVSGYKPHLLTQMFMTLPTNPNSGAPTPAGMFTHRAPWLQSNAMIYRALEFFEGGLRPQWTPIGGRFPGRINLNTVWDVDTFNALCSQMGINYFTQQGVTDVYNKMIASRTPNTVPGTTDNPFWSLAAPFGNPIYPNGNGVSNTLLRPDPNPAATYQMMGNVPKLLFETDPNANPAEMQNDPNTGQPTSHPYLNYELLTKIFGNSTVRSNVFAVWITVGFFEVTSTGALGNEIGRSENRHVRHRMFAVLDRTALTVALNPQAASPVPAVPLAPGPRPWFINALSPVTQAGQATITVPTLSGNYEEATWSIQQGTQLVVDSGANQEVVTVTGVNAVGLQFTANFQNPHPTGFAISNALLGNPGPQPVFDPRNPLYQGVVRYFSIIE